MKRTELIGDAKLILVMAAVTLVALAAWAALPVFAFPFFGSLLFCNYKYLYLLKHLGEELASR